MLKSSSMALTVIRCVMLLKSPTRRFQPGGDSGRKGRRPADPPWSPRDCIPSQGESPTRLAAPWHIRIRPDRGLCETESGRLRWTPVSWTESRRS